MPQRSAGFFLHCKNIS